MKYFIHLAYNGSKFRGWQRQPKVRTVQATLEDAFSKMLGYTIACKGCGRTDARVHASQFFCHLRIKEPLNYDPVFRLNKMLPSDIVIFDIIPVPTRAKVQLQVVDRSYTYYIHGFPNPFINTLSSYYALEGLDIAKMIRAAKLFKGDLDFKHFCKQPDLYDSTICRVSEIQLVQKSANRLVFTITANRFLRGMIRILVAHLLDVGAGKLELETIEKALRLETGLKILNLAYPQGLYLSRVRYDFLDVAPREAFN